MQDLEARQKFYEDYNGIIPHIVNKYDVNPSEVEDLYSRGRFALWKATETYREDSGVQFKTYAYKCVKNSIVSELMKLNRKNNKELLESQTEKDEDMKKNCTATDKASLSLCIGDTDDLYLRDWIKVKVDEYIDKTREANRNSVKTVIDLCFINGYTFEEVADIMGVTRQATNKLYNRFLGWLVDEYKREFV